MKKSILVVPDDFNSPSDTDGLRRVAVFDLLLQEEVISGGVRTGDPIFAFFDPYGELGEGYGIGGTVVSCTITHNAEGERWVWITYRDDFNSD